MASIIVPDRREERHLHHRDKLTDRLLAAGFVAVVFLITCTDVLGRTVDPAPAAAGTRASA